MEGLKIKATSRGLVGKQVKQLRAQGVTPVHLYGHGVDSRSLQVETVSLEKLFSQAGTSHLVDLTVGKTRTAVKVLVREVQRNPINDQLLHVDFFQVTMTEEITVEVPVTVVGEPGAKRLMVEHMLHQLSVKCLPGNIPPGLELDISSLSEPGQGILIKDIDFGAGVSVNHDPDDIIVRVESPRTAVAEEVAVGEEATGVEAEAVAEKAPSEED
ncbi:MAG: 50S ribosomal protein L25 [Dehalococcoidia bacterium]|nr:50S ribosomal protein L25 [Dehalococcoidia bacterium]